MDLFSERIATERSIYAYNIALKFQINNLLVALIFNERIVVQYYNLEIRNFVIFILIL